MTSEEMQQTMEFLLQQNAESARQHAEARARLTDLETNAITVLETVRLLVGVVQAQGERMDSFVKTIERYVQARGSNGTGS